MKMRMMVIMIGMGDCVFVDAVEIEIDCVRVMLLTKVSHKHLSLTQQTHCLSLL